MVDRLRKIASYYDLSPAAFADLVGVSRPVISHIFSERNKPSLEVVQKIGNAFPELNLEWLLFGNGEMLKMEAAAAEPAAVKEKPENRNIEEPLPVTNPQQDQNYTIPPLVKEKRKLAIQEAKTVTRIVFFYADNTFSEFKPTD